MKRKCALCEGAVEDVYHASWCEWERFLASKQRTAEWLEKHRARSS